MRRPATLIGAMLLLPASITFAVPANNILVSGQTSMAIIDTDDNGPDMYDCQFGATTDAMGNFIVNPTQGNSPMLRACTGKYAGNVDPSFPTDTSVFGTFTSSMIVGGIGFPNLPFSFDGTFVPQGGGGGGGAAASDTRTIAKLVLTDGNGTVVGSGLVCDGNAKVTLANGLSLLVGLDMGTPGFVRIKDLPFEKADFSGFVLKDVYVPKTAGIVTFSLSSDPTNFLIQILLSGSCGRGAPTLSAWSLIGLAFALLAVGAWMLGRRQGFYEALPLP